jgi:hypothetical protein
LLPLNASARNPDNKRKRNENLKKQTLLVEKAPPVNSEQLRCAAFLFYQTQPTLTPSFSRIREGKFIHHSERLYSFWP